MNILLVGYGNMGAALAHGWKNRPDVRLGVLCRSDQSAVRAEAAGLAVIRHTESGAPNPINGADNTDVLVLAVKPKDAVEALQVASKMTHTQTEPPLVLSVAAGVRTETLSAAAGHQNIVRAMPNTPAAIGMGVTGLYAPVCVSEKNRERAALLMEAVGTVLWVGTEEQMDAVTAVAGSGPAYVFLLAEILTRAAEEAGMSTEKALPMVLQTVRGAAELAMQRYAEEGMPPEELRKQVTSPNGTTAAALEVLQQGGWSKTLTEALEAARQRAHMLGKG